MRDAWSVCHAPWDNLIYRAVVRKEIEAGLADSKANRVTPVDDVLREFGLASRQDPASH